MLVGGPAADLTYEERPRAGHALGFEQGVQEQDQGHETTYAQIVAEELGLPAAAISITPQKVWRLLRKHGVTE